MQKSMVLASVFGCLFLGYAGRADAQRLSALGMRGTVESASATVPANDTATVYTTPAGRPFVLTQVCLDAGGVVVQGATFGVIPGEMGACTTYHPGIALPRDEAISCENPNGVPVNCMVTGIVTR